MATIINAGTTSTTGLSITTDTSGALVFQTGGVNALSISTSEVVTLANPLPAGSGGTGITSLGANVATFLGTPTAANLLNAVVGDTGTGNVVFSTSPTILTANLISATLSSANLSSANLTSSTLVSPTLTGVPIAPTAAAGTNTTQIATTAFALANGIPSGAILLWSGSVGTIPSGWYLCDGTNSTPDLTNSFVIGAGDSYAVGATGGSTTTSISTTNLPSHTHTFSGSGTASGNTGSSATGVYDSGHLHNSGGNGAPNGGGAGSALTNGGNSQNATLTNYANIQDPTHFHSFSAGVSISGTTDATGSGGAFSILPPYYALCYIMKA